MSHNPTLEQKSLLEAFFVKSSKIETNIRLKIPPYIRENHTINFKCKSRNRSRACPEHRNGNTGSIILFKSKYIYEVKRIIINSKFKYYNTAD